MARFLRDTGAKTNPPPLPKTKRFTYVLRDSNDDKHCSGINCVKLGRSVEGTQKDFLFTGSRDGTLKRWQLGAHATAFGATFESHTDWVNDVVFAGTDTLVSCSSDSTLKTWRAFSNPECTRTFKQHSDYVMSLAVARHSNNIVASGGLGCEVFLWDLEAAMTPIARASAEGLEELITSDGNLTTGAVPGIGDCPTLAKSFLTAHQKAKGNKNSICAVSINEAGTTLVSGGMEKDIRVWDPRTGTKQMKLKGHTDNVRALVLDPAGRLCISGSSDSMIRLWDLGQQRCVHSYAVHTDSVWALAATPSFSHVYSGGRDKSVCVTDLLTRDSTLLCLEEHPVLQFELQEENFLWIATDNSSINKWPTGQENLGKRPPRAGSAGSSQFARDGSAPQELPLHSTPTAVIPGTPAIVRHIILNDRRHVLTKDGAGVVKMWEITRGTVINDYGAVSFEEKVKELSEMVGNNVPAWFTIDAKLGSISVHLDAPQCFSAEISAADLLVPNATDELKLNLGRETLRGIFVHWLDRRRHQVVDHAPTPNPDGGKAEVTGKHGENWLSWFKKAQLAHQLDNSHEQAGNQQIAVLPAFEFSTTSPPLIITEGSEGGPWRKKSTDLDGTEDEKELPLWCIECVLRGSPQTPPGNNATRSSVSNGYSEDTLDAFEKFTSINLSTVRAPSQAERPQATTLEDSDRDNFRFGFPRLKSIVSLRSDKTDNFPISKQIELWEDGDLYTDLRRPPQIQLQRVDRAANSCDNVVIDIGFGDRIFRYDNKILGYGNNDETDLDNFSIRKCIRGFFKKMTMRSQPCFN